MYPLKNSRFPCACFFLGRSRPQNFVHVVFLRIRLDGRVLVCVSVLTSALRQRKGREPPTIHHVIITSCQGQGNPRLGGVGVMGGGGSCMTTTQM